MPEDIAISSENKASSDFEKSENSKFADKSVVASAETIRDIEESSEIENLKKVEAALFISARFLTLQDLVMLTDINPLMIKELLLKLIEKYNKEDSAIEIIIKDNMWKMDVRQEYVHMINKLATGSAEFSKAEQETLAVIAYKQPVKQSVIINIRGNKAYEHIKHFIDIGLVISKRAGHTLELRLSDDFFEYFHLQNRDGKVILDDHSNSNESQEEFEGLQKKEKDGKVIAVEEDEGEDADEGEDEKKEDESEKEDGNEKEEKEEVENEGKLRDDETK